MGAPLDIFDPGNGVTTTIWVTKAEAAAIIAMSPGEELELEEGSTAERHDPDDGMIWVCGHGVRPCGRRRDLLPQLRRIQRGDSGQ